MKKVVAIIALLASAMLLAGVSLGGGYGDSAKAENATAKNATVKDIVDTAIAAGNFTMLVSAVQAAGLVDILKSPGPFTVFAPDDAAFAKIPKADLDALVANKTALTKVLTYHVVPGKKIMLKDLKDGMNLKTAQGTNLTIKRDQAGVMVDNAKVTKTDIETSNGVIHVIDAVVMPK